MSLRWMLTIDHTGPVTEKLISSWLDRAPFSVSQVFQNEAKITFIVPAIYLNEAELLKEV